MGQIGTNQMGQIRDFSRSDFSTFWLIQTLLKSDLEKSWIFPHSIHCMHHLLTPEDSASDMYFFLIDAKIPAAVVFSYPIR